MQPDITETIAKIRSKHRQRMFAMEQRKRSDLALGSFLRLMCGWQKDGDEEVNKAAKETAAALIKAGEAESALLAALEAGDVKAASKIKPVDAPAEYEEWRGVILASVAARKPLDKVEAEATKAIEALAELLPVWRWAQNVKGFGSRSLGTIVAEAGDLSAYPKKGHLWKRMGLAVMGGKRQGGLPKNASKEEWILHGYNRKRRSHMYVIGDVLVKVGDHYKQVFRDRCAYEYARAVEAGYEVVTPLDSTIETWAKRGLVVRKVTKAKFNAATMVGAGHLHRRAQRYMEKKLLRDLLQAWRRGQSEATLALPSESKVKPSLPSSAHLIAAE